MKLYIPDMEKIGSLSREELAYMAGFFDGEGNITVSSAGRSKPSCKVSVAQNKPKVLLWMQDIFGGTVRQLFRDTDAYVKSHGTTHANGFDWSLHGVNGPVIFLSFLLPYLRIKDDEAREAIFIMNNRDKLTKDECSERIDNIRQLRIHKE